MKKIFCRLLQEDSIIIEFTPPKNHSTPIINTSQPTETNKYHTISDCRFTPGISSLQSSQEMNMQSQNSYASAIYTKDNFLVTESNKEIINAAQYYIEKNTFWTSILFIYGKHGVGKTHLLFALKHLLMEKNITILYVHAEEFLKKYINAAKQKTIYQLEKQFKNVNILLFDDFEYLEDKQYTQEFLFQIIKEFTETGKKIIFTAKNHITDMPGIIATLRLKINTALAFHYQQATTQDIKNILGLKIKLYNYDFPLEFLDTLATTKDITIEQAEILIHKIIAQTVIAKKTISEDMLLEHISLLPNEKKKRIISVEEIIIVIEKYLKKNLSEIIFEKNKDAVKYRYLIIYIARKIYNIPCTVIAKYFKYKDHTTISYACKTYLTHYKNDPEMKNVTNLFYK
jgi:chromosomal replication initiator protein